MGNTRVEAWAELETSSAFRGELGNMSLSMPIALCRHHVNDYCLRISYHEGFFLNRKNTHYFPSATAGHGVRDEVWMESAQVGGNN